MNKNVGFFSMLSRQVFLLVTKTFLNDNAFLRIPRRTAKLLHSFDHFFAGFVHHAPKDNVSSVEPEIAEKEEES